MAGSLEGKIAVVTGGGTGIGLATAKKFSAEGAFVFIIGRRQAELDAAASEIGDNVQAVQGDVSNLADLDRFYATIKAKKGRIDILFANAAVAEGAPLGAITEDHFDRHFDINVKGLVFALLAHLDVACRGIGLDDRPTHLLRCRERNRKPLVGRERER